MELTIPKNGKGTPQSSTSATVEEHEPLFPDEFIDDEPIVNTMDVTKKIYAIRFIEKRITQYQKQDQESRLFYLTKVEQCQQQIEFIKRNILAFIRQNNLKNIQTPAGTAYQRDITMKQWPSEDVLIAWATANVPEAVRVKQEPDKKLLLEYMKITGERPDGYREATETRLYLK